jgi:hypothetical protein
MNRFKKVLLKPESTLKPEQESSASLISDWQKILVITKLIYGPGSLYSILNFVKDEGAQLNRTEKGYFLNPGQISEIDWEDIKQNLLSPFRAEVKAIFQYAFWNDGKILKFGQEIKETSYTADWQKVLEATRMLYGSSGSLYSALRFIAGEGAVLIKSKKGYALRPGQIPEAEWHDIMRSLLAPFRKEIKIVFRYALWRFVAVKSALLNGDVIVFCDRVGVLPKKIFEQCVYYSAKELEELVGGNVDLEGIKLIHEAKKRFGGFIESNEH